MDSPPYVLSIAGSDPSGGAGLQADLKTFAAFGVYGMAAVSALTAQNTRGVRAVEPVSPAWLRAQLDALADDLPIHAVKIGMLGAAPLVEEVARFLERVPHAPVVLDPVLRSTSGRPLLDEAGRSALHALLPRVTLVTPNLPEAEALWGGWPPDHLAPAVLLKGGHGAGARLEERLILAGELRQRWEHPRHPGEVHGTGCALSSAIAACLALGQPLESAISEGLAFVDANYRRAQFPGGGAGLFLHHRATP